MVNPFFPGYVPKSTEEPTNIFYPGEYNYPGKPKTRRPVNRNFLEPVSYDFNELIESIDNLSANVEGVPRAFYDQKVADLKSNLKFAVRPKGVSAEQLDDYPDEFSGATGFGVSVDPDKLKDPEKYGYDLLKDAVKITTGIDISDVSKSNFADFGERIAKRVWKNALDAETDLTKDPGAAIKATRHADWAELTKGPLGPKTNNPLGVMNIDAHYHSPDFVDHLDRASKERIFGVGADKLSDKQLDIQVRVKLDGAASSVERSLGSFGNSVMTNITERAAGTRGGRYDGEKSAALNAIDSEFNYFKLLGEAGVKTDALDFAELVKNKEFLMAANVVSTDAGIVKSLGDISYHLGETLGKAASKDAMFSDNPIIPIGINSALKDGLGADYSRYIPLEGVPDVAGLNERLAVYRKSIIGSDENLAKAWFRLDDMAKNIRAGFEDDPFAENSKSFFADMMKSAKKLTDEELAASVAREGVASVADLSAAARASGERWIKAAEATRAALLKDGQDALNYVKNLETTLSTLGGAEVIGQEVTDKIKKTTSIVRYTKMTGPVEKGYKIVDLVVPGDGTTILAGSTTVKNIVRIKVRSGTEISTAIAQVSSSPRKIFHTSIGGATFSSGDPWGQNIFSNYVRGAADRHLNGKNAKVYSGGVKSASEFINDLRDRMYAARVQALNTATDADFDAESVRSFVEMLLGGKFLEDVGFPRVNRRIGSYDLGSIAANFVNRYAGFGLKITDDTEPYMNLVFGKATESEWFDNIFGNRFTIDMTGTETLGKAAGSIKHYSLHPSFSTKGFSFGKVVFTGDKGLGIVGLLGMGSLLRDGSFYDDPEIRNIVIKLVRGNYLVGGKFSEDAFMVDRDILRNWLLSKGLANETKDFLTGVDNILDRYGKASESFQAWVAGIQGNANKMRGAGALKNMIDVSKDDDDFWLAMLSRLRKENDLVDTMSVTRRWAGIVDKAWVHLNRLQNYVLNKTVFGWAMNKYFVAKEALVDGIVKFLGKIAAPFIKALTASLSSATGPLALFLSGLIERIFTKIIMPALKYTIGKVVGFFQNFITGLASGDPAKAFMAIDKEVMVINRLVTMLTFIPILIFWFLSTGFVSMFAGTIPQSDITRVSFSSNPAAVGGWPEGENEYVKVEKDVYVGRIVNPVGFEMNPVDPVPNDDATGGLKVYYRVTVTPKITIGGGSVKLIDRAFVSLKDYSTVELLSISNYTLDPFVEGRKIIIWIPGPTENVYNTNVQGTRFHDSLVQNKVTVKLPAIPARGEINPMDVTFTRSFRIGDYVSDCPLDPEYTISTPSMSSIGGSGHGSNAYWRSVCSGLEGEAFDKCLCNFAIPWVWGAANCNTGSSAMCSPLPSDGSYCHKYNGQNTAFSEYGYALDVKPISASYGAAYRVTLPVLGNPDRVWFTTACDCNSGGSSGGGGCSWGRSITFMTGGYKLYYTHLAFDEQPGVLDLGCTEGARYEPGDVIGNLKTNWQVPCLSGQQPPCYDTSQIHLHVELIDMSSDIVKDGSILPAGKGKGTPIPPESMMCQH